MRSVKYGSKSIKYSIQEKEGLKSHYISVEKHAGVVLKGKPVSDKIADRLILKKARWILQKQELVRPIADDEIVTGSRLPYFGKNYYVEVITVANSEKVTVEFNYSKFKIYLNRNSSQGQIKAAIGDFYKEKAIQKITSRVIKIAAKSKLIYSRLLFRKMSKRWGSCTSDNKIILNIDAVKLSYSLIDYLIIHELCHTRVKDHTRAFWALLSKHCARWRELDEKIKELKF